MHIIITFWQQTLSAPERLPKQNNKKKKSEMEVKVQVLLCQESREDTLLAGEIKHTAAKVKERICDLQMGKTKIK